jgi:hypothetical protein
MQSIPNFQRLLSASILQSGEILLMLCLYVSLKDILNIYLEAIPIWILLAVSINFDKTKKYFLTEENIGNNYFYQSGWLKFFGYSILINKSLQIYGIWMIFLWLIVIYVNFYFAKEYRIFICPLLYKILRIPAKF